MPDSREPAALSDAARLCLDCGLCCNGVLFDQVRLQPGDHAKALTARGLKIKKGQWFNQPCTALRGSLCQLYQDRPLRCRQFECRQFRGVAAGDIRHESAAARIADVREQVAGIEAQLSAMGGGNLRKPLAQRYATAREASPDAEGFSAVTAAMNRLQAALDEHFRI
jgi:hypothetical protein